jgi:hypothetical protein
VLNQLARPWGASSPVGEARLLSASPLWATRWPYLSERRPGEVTATLNEYGRCLSGPYYRRAPTGFSRNTDLVRCQIVPNSTQQHPDLRAPLALDLPPPGPKVVRGQVHDNPKTSTSGLIEGAIGPRPHPSFIDVFDQVALSRRCRSPRWLVVTRTHHAIPSSNRVGLADISLPRRLPDPPVEHPPLEGCKCLIRMRRAS